MRHVYLQHFHLSVCCRFACFHSCVRQLRLEDTLSISPVRDKTSGDQDDLSDAFQSTVYFGYVCITALRFVLYVSPWLLLCCFGIVIVVRRLSLRCALFGDLFSFLHCCSYNEASDDLSRRDQESMQARKVLRSYVENLHYEITSKDVAKLAPLFLLLDIALCRIYRCLDNATVVLANTSVTPLKEYTTMILSNIGAGAFGSVFGCSEPAEFVQGSVLTKNTGKASKRSDTSKLFHGASLPGP